VHPKKAGIARHLTRVNPTLCKDMYLLCMVPFGPYFNPWPAVTAATATQIAHSANDIVRALTSTGVAVAAVTMGRC
jgi:hypothetical protein